MRIMAYLAAAMMLVALWALGCSMASGRSTRVVLDRSSGRCSEPLLLNITEKGRRRGLRRLE
jgi:hypothetical protein